MELTRYQKFASRWMKPLRVCLLLWRRQAGKSTLFAFKILQVMLENPGILCTFVSASLSVGSELPFKATQIFGELLQTLRDVSIDNGVIIESNGEGLEDSDLMDLFDQGRLEVTFRHSEHVVSRMKVIAPNIATARGYSGWVFMDEIGFIKDFRALFGEMEPIISRDPTFHLIMATTPPSDDAHFSYELAAPEPGTEFENNPSGNTYTSQLGIPVHRVDAWDADLAGIHLYDMKSGAQISPDEHRKNYFNRDTWDRSYALKFIVGGTAAIPLSAIGAAQELGYRMSCVAAENDLPADWAISMTSDPYAIGYDVATTTNKMSNPSSIVVTQKVSQYLYVERLVFRFKEANPDEAKALLREILESCQDATGRRASGLAVDSSNEKYYAANVRKEFRKYTRVMLCSSSETIDYQGQSMNMKTYTGQRYVEVYEDSQIAMPPDRWVKEDRRLAKKVKGGFDNELDNAGNHADTFDGGKLALYALNKRGGKIEAKAVNIGTPFSGNLLS